jgi:transposase
MYYIGIDWSSSFNDISILDHTGNFIKHFRADVTSSGFACIQTELNLLSKDHSDFCIGIETDKNILADYLITAEHTVYNLNPLCVKRFKDSQSPTPKKNDKYDSIMIATMLFRDKAIYKPVMKSSYNSEYLKSICGIMNDLTSQRTRLTNALRSNLMLYFPAFSEFFTEMDSSVALNILKLFPLPDDFLSVDKSDYNKIVKSVKYLAAKRAEKIYDFMKEKSLSLKTPNASACAIKSVMLADQILLLNHQITELDKEIKKLYEHSPMHKIFDSIPGAGLRIGSQLMALFGDNPEKFASYNAVQCYAGTCPSTQSSGKNYHSVKMRKACNKNFRKVLYQLSFARLQKKDEWSSLEYYAHRKNGKSHSAALRIISNKWAKIIYAMWRDKTEYNDANYVYNRKKITEAA